MLEMFIPERQLVVTKNNKTFTDGTNGQGVPRTREPNILSLYF